MARFLLPLLLGLAGLGAGLGAGFAMKPPAVTSDAEAAAPAPATPGVFIDMSSHFVVPLIEGDRIRSMLMLTLGIEVSDGGSAAIRAQEPRLRDTFLRVLFDHANSGGFDGVFTAASPMATLRSRLREAAQDLVGPDLRDVLILDLVRQD